MMRPAHILATIAIAILPLPALASSCAEQIGTIERRLDSAGAVQVAGLREGHSIRSGSPRGIEAACLDEPSDPGMVSTAVHVAEARTLILRAGDEDRHGDQRAAITQALARVGFR